MFVEYVFPDAKWISLSDEVRVFSSMMRAQTNLRVEAEHLTKFSRNFKASNTVQFPNPLLEYCSNDVLVEEYVDGIPLARLLEVVDGSANEIGDFAELKKEIAGIGINAFLKMLLQDNFVHSDLHPGNLLVTFAAVENTRKGTWSGWWGEDNETYREQHEHQCGSLTELANLDDEAFCNALNQLSATSRPVLVLVDTGLVSSLSQANLTNLRDLLVAVSSFDGIRVSHLLAERSPNPGPVHDMPLLESRMSELLASVKRSALRLSAVTFGGILISVFDMVRQHQVKLEGEFANVGIALMLVEGIGRRLDPNVDLLQFLRSFLPSSSLRML
ncbi:hypothetical protein DFJ73DRAFT_180318 [Zopfochytrium polystomum]|nr:hypothetical protein DFJ73DRAFT_180318 [Zopfochytrium polystomum]